MIGRVVAIGGISLAAALVARATEPVAEGEFDTVVANYVAEGLRSNLALQSETRIREQRRRWPRRVRDSFPSFLSRRATPARRWTRIDDSVGDGAESRLFDAERVAGRSRSARAFPLAKTHSVLAPRKQDTRVVVRQPLYAPAIPAAVRAQRALLDASNFNRMAVARALRRTSRSRTSTG